MNTSSVSSSAGEVFHSSVPGRLSLSSASDRCVSLGGQLATVGQLYLAWRAGLDSCAPGWLADGSVRYPVTWPRPDCGGSRPGVRTVALNATHGNETALYDAYCYRGNPEPGGNRSNRSEEVLSLWQQAFLIHTVCLCVMYCKCERARLMGEPEDGVCLRDS